MLRQQGFKKNTLILYRQVLRNLANHSQTTPSQITYNIIMKYIYHLTDNHVSASWLAMNISVLRTCFDKCCGTTLLETRVGPKRPRQLPAILAHEEIQKMMAGLIKPITAMTLRHTYAVHQLQAGVNIREVQENLGLHSLETMLRYQQCIPLPEFQPSSFSRLFIPIPHFQPSVFSPHPFYFKPL